MDQKFAGNLKEIGLNEPDNTRLRLLSEIMVLSDTIWPTSFKFPANALAAPRPRLPDQILPERARQKNAYVFYSAFLDQKFAGNLKEVCQIGPDDIRFGIRSDCGLL